MGAISYGKLLEEYDLKIDILNAKRIESDGLRHELYRKRDSETQLTPAEEAEIEERRDFEQGISYDLNRLSELLENVYEAMNNLKAELDMHSDSI